MGCVKRLVLSIVALLLTVVASGCQRFTFPAHPDQGAAYTADFPAVFPPGTHQLRVTADCGPMPDDPAYHLFVVGYDSSTDMWMFNPVCDGRTGRPDAIFTVDTWNPATTTLSFAYGDHVVFIGTPPLPPAVRTASSTAAVSPSTVTITVTALAFDRNGNAISVVL